MSSVLSRCRWSCRCSAPRCTLLVGRHPRTAARGQPRRAHRRPGGRRWRCWCSAPTRRPAGRVRRRLAGAARHRAGRRPAVGADAGGLRRPSTLGVLVYSIGQGMADGDGGDPAVDLPPDVPGPDRRRLQRVPRRRPVQPLRRLRDPAGRQLRAAHPRRHRRRGSGPARPTSWSACSRSLLFLVAIGADLRRHRHAQPGPARRPARRAARRRAAGCCSRCCCSPSASRRRSSRCRRGCPTATRPRRRRSPRCSPACSPRSASTRSSAPRRCCSPAAGARRPADVGGAWLTMVVGILGAVAQSDIKRMLSFTLVSHIGYMMFGIGAGDDGRAGRRDLLRGPPHHHPDHAVPGRRPDRAAGRQHRRWTGSAGWRGSPRCSACCSSCRR